MRSATNPCDPWKSPTRGKSLTRDGVGGPNRAKSLRGGTSSPAVVARCSARVAPEVAEFLERALLVLDL